MSLATNLQNFTTRVATEFKAIRTLIGGTGTSGIGGLVTTDKSSLVAAINEVQTTAGAKTLDELTDVVITAPADGHILRHDGVDWDNVLGSTYFDIAGSAAAAQAASQPLDGDLTAIAALTTTPFGRGLLALANAAALTAQVEAATELVAGKVELATQAETNAGTDDTRAVTPLKFQTRLAAFAQPKDSDLDAISALTTTAYGRAFLTLADQAGLMALMRLASETATGVVELATAAETTAGVDATRAVHPAGLKVELDKKANTSSLAAVATSGNAADLTGVLSSAQLPALAITSVSVVASQAAMLALTAQEGDVAKRSDTGQTFMLATAPASTLANWVELEANGDVLSVAGKVGVVTLVKGDVGLGNVDNTSDLNKPVSTATQTALNAKQNLDATLTALAGLTTAANQVILATGVDTFSMFTTGTTGRNVLASATALAARTEIDVYSKAEIGNPETDFVATFEAGLL
jgi:hypothetical protein